MKKQVKDSERVQPCLRPKPLTITISVKREKGVTTIDNGMGRKWKLKDLSTGVAVTALIAHTLEIRERALCQFADKFKITLTIEEIIF